MSTAIRVFPVQKMKSTITEERSLESVTSILFIPNVVAADEGGYYCTAWIGLVSTSSQTAYLKQIGEISEMVKILIQWNLS